MSWITPLVKAQEAAAKRKARDVVIDGIHYPSIYKAQKALGCSSSKIYRLMGEGWRVKCK